MLGPGRAAEAGTDVFGGIASPRQPMNKASPRGIAAAAGSGGGAGSRGFARVSKVTEVREGRPLSRSNAVDSIKSDASPPSMEPLSKAGYVRGSRMATPKVGIETPRQRGLPLVEWMWPSNASASSIANMGESAGGVGGDGDVHLRSVSPDGLDYDPEGRVTAKRLTASQENGKRLIMQQSMPTPMTHQPSARPAVVIGKICEPVRPTRLDLSGPSEARTPSSRVIYTAKGGHNLNLDAPDTPGAPMTPLNAASTTATTNTRSFFGGRPTALCLSALKEGVVGSRGGRSRPRSASGGAPPGAWTRSSNKNNSNSKGRALMRTSSAFFSGLKSPRYLNSTTVSQAKTMEPPGGAGATSHRHHHQGGGGGGSGVVKRSSTRPPPRRRSSIDDGEHTYASSSAVGNTDASVCSSVRNSRGGVGGVEEDGREDGCVGSCAGVGGWKASGFVGQLGGFFRLGRVNSGGGGGRGEEHPVPAVREHGAGLTVSAPRTPRMRMAKATTPRAGGGGATAATVSSRIARLSEVPGVSAAGAVKGTKSAAKAVGGKGSGKRGKSKTRVTRSTTAPEQHLSHRPRRRDERPVLTIHTQGLVKPEGVRFRVVKASGRTLNDTLFHIEIRTLRPGQVWSVCRKYGDFQRLHVALQEQCLAEIELPRLPRPPLAGPLEPATLERARAALQAYVGTVVAEVPCAWENEEFVMFLDADEKGRRLFAHKRRKEPRRVSTVPTHQDSTSKFVKSSSRITVPPVPFSPSPDSSRNLSLEDEKTEDKKMATAAKEDAAQNHFDGVGAVINTLLSFSEDDDVDADLGLDDESDFIDGEDAIRAMLDRDAEEAEDDNLFSIPAGTDFGALDDDIGDDFDLTYHG